MHVDLVATKNTTRKASYFKRSWRWAFVKKMKNRKMEMTKENWSKERRWKIWRVAETEKVIWKYGLDVSQNFETYNYRACFNIAILWKNEGTIFCLLNSKIYLRENNSKMCITTICIWKLQQQKRVKMMSLVCPLSNAKDHLAATRPVSLISYKRKTKRKINSKKVIWSWRGNDLKLRREGRH